LPLIYPKQDISVLARDDKKQGNHGAISTTNKKATSQMKSGLFEAGFL